MKSRSARGPAVVAVALLTVVLIAACGGGGGSSSSSSTTSSNSAAANAPTSPGSAIASRFAKAEACLKKYGVSLPNFGGRRFGATGGAGFGGRFGGGRFGATGRFGAPPRGGFGPTGGRGVFGGGGGFGAGRVGGLRSNSKFAQAAKKCGLSGALGGRFGASGPGGAPTGLSAAARAQVTKFHSCMSKNGVKLPVPNLSGRGPVFNTGQLNTSSATFTSAYGKCKSIITLVPTGGAPPSA
jgi:hypothetical protein